MRFSMKSAQNLREEHNGSEVYTKRSLPSHICIQDIAGDVLNPRVGAEFHEHGWRTWAMKSTKSNQAPMENRVIHATRRRIPGMT